MGAYIVRRSAFIIPTLLLVTIFVFCLVRIIPGTVIDLMVSEMAQESGLGAELTAEYLRHSMGLDVPIHVQYGRWLGVCPSM